MRLFRQGLLAAILILTMGTGFAEPGGGAAPPPSPQVQGPVVPLNLKLDGSRNNVSLGRLGNGSLVYIVGSQSDGQVRYLSAEEFSDAYYRQQAHRQGWLPSIFNVTTPVGIVWVLLGLVGQMLFAGRMIVQWFASEKSRRSVIPVSFWWLSLAGATMLLLYFIWRRDIVGIIGQATGWVIYVRNLSLIRQSPH